MHPKIWWIEAEVFDFGQETQYRRWNASGSINQYWGFAHHLNAPEIVKSAVKLPIKLWVFEIPLVRYAHGTCYSKIPAWRTDPCMSTFELHSYSPDLFSVLYLLEWTCGFETTWWWDGPKKIIKGCTWASNDTTDVMEELVPPKFTVVHMCYR